MPPRSPPKEAFFNALAHLLVQMLAHSYMGALHPNIVKRRKFAIQRWFMRLDRLRTLEKREDLVEL